MKTRYKILVIGFIAFSILFVPPNIAVYASGHDVCEPDMYGNLWCDPPVEDRLTLERFLFEPPIINEKPTFPMGLVILVVSVALFVVWRKRK